MEFIVSKNSLLQALQHARTVVNTKCALPLYTNFFFSFSEDSSVNTMTVHASDGEIWFKENVLLDAPVVESRSISLYYYELLRALKSLDEQPLKFIVGEMQMTVEHSCGKFRIPLNNNADEYFQIPALNRYHFDDVPHDCASFEVPGLRSILNRCKVAMAQDELRPAMNGIYFNLSSEYSDFVSSDGHRLIRVRKAPMFDFGFSLIVPRKVVLAMLRIMPTTGDVYLGHKVMKTKDSDGKVNESYYAQFVIDDTITLCFQPWDGIYPKYWSVIPADDRIQAEVIVDRKALIKSIDRLIIFANDSSEMVKASISGETNTITLTASDKDFELDGEETIPCEYVNKYCMPSLHIGIKAPNVASLLKQLTTQQVLFRFVDDKCGFLIEPIPQPDVEKVTMLQMPMFLSD